ncbi:hypothetical protein FHX82_001692 [Amycolatopsis bartoniae]|uniref:DUF4234 domain-containing protein n=1 Tax=Amycolatopsis bartoniae TaxID=941986 RepID=A0A8H9MA17_9PSEU|nr:DUF4234 domain-containing protein [Amycolatopsis bartoniae]MBB2934672.1 hypothetical protein [Amycolatopsis bartoniae]TVT09331.1 DUF4234 domain-containing protein [Amycolatopsis bartoniae]GHF45647.1 hypothetical protein GCM10017566_18370 [Amycolatopsis bartoniae]
MTQPNPYQQTPVPVSPQPPAWTPAAPVATGQPVATGLSMKERNPVLVWLLWPLLTLGIYSLVWYYKIHKEMAEFDRRRAVPVAGPVLVLLFLSWTLIAPLVSYYNTGNRIRNAQRAAGLPETCSAVGGMLLMLVFGVGVVYYQSELNKICAAYGVPAGQQIPLHA